MKKLSLLLPIRKHSPLVPWCFEGILDSSDLSNTEVVAAIDKEDTENAAILALYRAWIDVTIVPVDMQYGRTGLHLYMNEIAKAATGELLWHICDDTRIVTHDYNLLLAPFIEKMSGRIFHGIPWYTYGTEPMITRAWIEATGHWARQSAVDSWVNNVSEALPQDRILTLYHVGCKDLREIEDEKGRNVNSVPSISADQAPYDSKEYWEQIGKDRQALLTAIERGK